MDKNTIIIEYIDNYIFEIRKLGINIPYAKIREVKDRFSNRSESIEELKKEIDELYQQYIASLMIPATIETVEKSEKITKDIDVFVGESYKSSLLGVFAIYERIMNDDSITNKEQAFIEERDKFLTKEVRRVDDYIESQISDDHRIRSVKIDMFKGYETLTLKAVGNLYNTFINDIDLVVPQNEGKMTYIVDNSKKIFASDGSINPDIYNFNDLAKVFEFAKEHNKEIKLHTLIWHRAVPENLQREIEALPVDQQRGALLTFINNYFSQMCKFINNGGYKLRQIDVLNEIVSDDDNKDLLRNSFFKRILGNNPNNGDNYYIDILRMARSYFPDVEFIYNDYNEFNPKKCDRICTLINDIREKSLRDGVNYIDGLGLQTHIAPYTSAAKNSRREVVPSFIYETMAKYNNLGIPLYRTEIDSMEFSDSNKYEEIVAAIRESDKHSNIFGISLWGNSDALGWSNSAEDGHFIHRDGTPKKSFNYYKELINSKRKKKEEFKDLEYLHGLFDRGMGSLDNNLGVEDIAFEQAKVFNEAYSKGKSNERAAIDKGREYFTKAVTLGFNNRDDILNASKYITTMNLSKNQDNIDKAKDALTELKSRNVKKEEKPKVMKKDNNSNTNKSNKGFTSVLFIILNLGIIGCGISAIMYIITNFS